MGTAALSRKGKTDSPDGVGIFDRQLKVQRFSMKSRGLEKWGDGEQKEMSTTPSLHKPNPQGSRPGRDRWGTATSKAYPTAKKRALNGQSHFSGKGASFQESIWSRFPQFCCFNPALACDKRGVFPSPFTKLQIAAVTMVVALRTFPQTETPVFRQNLS
jgi:hypothetical protein